MTPPVAAHVLRLDHEPIVGAVMRLGRVLYAETLIVIDAGGERVVHRQGEEVARVEPCSSCGGARITATGAPCTRCSRP